MATVDGSRCVPYDSTKPSWALVGEGESERRFGKPGPLQVTESNPPQYWLRLVLFVALALLPVVGLLLLLLAIYARGPGAYLLVIVGAVLILALPFGKFMFFPTTTLEHLYRGWILRRLNISSKSSPP
jgi:hypothetical protein